MSEKQSDIRAEKTGSVNGTGYDAGKSVQADSGICVPDASGNFISAVLQYGTGDYNADFIPLSGKMW